MKLRLFIDLIISLFTKKEIYQDICFKWKKTGLSFLIAIIILTCLPNLTSILSYALAIDISKIKSIDLDDGLDDNVKQGNDLNIILHDVITQIPLIHIENGIADNKGINPTEIILPGSEKILAVIDTSNNSKITTHYKSLVYLTDKQFIIGDLGEQNGNKYYTIGELFISPDQIIIDNESIYSFIAKMQKISYWVIPFIYFPLFVLASFTLNLIKILIFSLAGFGFAKLNRNNNIAFIQIFRIGIMSLIPSLVISFIFASLPISNVIILKFAYWAIFFSSVAYFFFALKSCLEMNLGAND